MNVVLSFLLLLSLPPVHGEPGASGPEWSLWRGPLGNGIYPDETGWTAEWPPGGPRRLWRVEVGIGYSSLAVSEGRAYTVGNVEGEDVVYCLDAEKGAVLWTHRYPQELVPIYNPGGPNAPPVIDGPWLYVFSKQGLLSCLAKSDGEVRWRIDLAKVADAEMPTWGFASAPAIIGDRLYLNANESGVAIDKNTGKVLWNSKSAECGYAAAVPMRCRGEESLAILGHAALRVVRQSDGVVQWQVDWPTKMGENSADPVPFDGKLYVSSWWDMGAAVFDPNRDGSEPLWRSLEFQNHISAPVPHEGCFYGFDGPVHRPKSPGALRCVEAATGKTLWSQQDLKGSLIVAAGKLLILSNDGKLIVAEASKEGYTERARLEGLGKRTWAPPVLHHGRVYIRDADGWAMCYDLNPAR